LIAATARTIDAPPLATRALEFLGQAYGAHGDEALAERTLEEALADADARGLWPDSIDIHLALVELIGTTEAHYDEALRPAQLAGATARAHGAAHEPVDATLAEARILSLLRRGDEALAASQVALEASTRSHAYDRAQAEVTLSITLDDL